MSLDITQVEELAIRTGTAVLADEYQPQQEIWRQFISDVITPQQCSDFEAGDKSTTLVAEAQIHEREDGQEIEFGTMGTGYKPQGKVRQFSLGIKVPDRLARQMSAGAGGEAAFVNWLSEWTRQANENWMLYREKMIARMFNKGSLSAGDKEAFDGSYAGNDDPNPTLIYDGKPWFDTQHNPYFARSVELSNHTASRPLGTDGNLDLALQQMMVTAAKDENNEEITIAPRFLLHPPALRRTAYQVLQSEKVPSTANNAANPEQGILTPIQWRFLEDNDGWFIGTGRGIRVIDGGPLVPELYRDHRTKSLVYTLESHFGAYVRDWRHWQANNTSAT